MADMAALAAENARLQQEMEAAARARESERANEQRTTMERMLMRSMQQLGGGGGGGMNNGANGGMGDGRTKESFGVRSDALELLEQVCALLFLT